MGLTGSQIVCEMLRRNNVDSICRLILKEELYLLRDFRAQADDIGTDEINNEQLDIPAGRFCQSLMVYTNVLISDLFFCDTSKGPVIWRRDIPARPGNQELF